MLGLGDIGATLVQPGSVGVAQPMGAKAGDGKASTGTRRAPADHENALLRASMITCSGGVCQHGRVPPAERLVLSLTGPDSHTIDRTPGLGELVIGPPNPGNQPHVILGPDDRIDWSVFDEFTVPAGYPWPRWFTYRGNDTSFVEWARNRPIERFHWTPEAAVKIDASRARISSFTIHLGTEPVEVVVPHSEPGNGNSFSVSGDLSLFTPVLADGTRAPETLYLSTVTPPDPTGAPWRLPDLPVFAAAKRVGVYGQPLRQPFDCTSLLLFPRVEGVDLSGQLTNLEALMELSELTSLRISSSPDLSSFPPLERFTKLNRLMLSSIDEINGKRIRAEHRKLTKNPDREWHQSWVSELRKPEWFVTEHGLPFSEWPAKAGRVATKTYRTASAGIARATSAAEVEEAIRTFVRFFNTQPNIETIKRDDLGDAVALLATHAPFDVSPDLAQTWFDEERDY
ncbi:hypothetical protein [Allokutzneria sp. NRRL B-24872]|uniref:hypothetical protein n=1 Tax=Allokutzneria sp. NRRL B-24872 TaxID=1137961 RepID=UPI001177C428|nr:hypothetical protein [Allokutzneria sp. NRRL B-24872]